MSEVDWGAEDEEVSPEAWGEGDLTAEDDRAQYTTPAAQGMEEAAPGVWRQLGGAAELAGSVVSSVIAEPVAGLAGLGRAGYEAVTGGEDPLRAGAETAEETREALTYMPGTETGQEMAGDVASFLEPVGEAFGAVEEGLGGAVAEATGSPGLATAAHVLPTAALEILGLGLLKKPSQAAQAAAEAQKRVKVDPTLTPERMAVEAMDPEMRTYGDIAEDLKGAKGKAVAKDVRPDEEIRAAAQELGVDLNPGHYSTNEAFQRVEQAIKSQPDSALAAREAEAITALGNRADQLVTELGGELDRSILDQTIRGRMEGTIKDLEGQAEKIYRTVNDRIPPATKVNARAAKAYLNQRLNELGGDVTGLSKAERELNKVFSQDRPPTYARLDQLRRDIGAGFKNQGVFKDDLSGNLDQVYKALITDQQGVADALGAGKDFAAGRKLVQSRKQIEQRAMQLFGREMQRSFLPQLTQSATALTRGDTAKFKQLMEALPSDMRTAAAATMLNDLFMHGARNRGGSIGQGFANAYQALDRNAGAKAELFKYLPDDARRRFDAIGKVSQGIYRAKSLENTSRTARDILQALESGRLMQTVYGVARPAIAAATGNVGAAAGDAVNRAAKNTARRQKAADELLSSPSFERALNKASEGAVKEAEVMMKRSKAWQAFRNTLGEGTKAQLATVGIIPWLTSQQEQEQMPGGQ